MTDEDDELTERDQPSRYSRTTTGLVASLIVTVIAVGGFVVFRETFRDQPTFDAGPIDYIEPVKAAQDNGVELVYPTSLPKGWNVTSIDFVPGARPAWGIGMLTDDGRYVGLRQEDAEVDELVKAYVDANAEPGDESSFDSDLATGPWQTWADAGGDLAYSTALTEGAENTMGDTLLVYGSASRSDQEKLISLLSTSDIPS